MSTPNTEREILAIIAQSHRKGLLKLADKYELRRRDLPEDLDDLLSVWKDLCDPHAAKPTV